jgi:hypothetical protein
MHWMQLVANGHDREFLSDLREAGAVSEGATLKWVSPRSDDEFAEYSDSQFLRELGLKEAAVRLPDFWPKGGPWWDALAIASDGRYLLVEAKAHIGEMVSSPSGAESPDSIRLIDRSLAEAKHFYKAKPEVDWSKCFYQYCNRLAHLYWLREREGVEAELVFACFVGDSDMGGPTSDLEWRAAIKLLERFLGVTEHKLRSHVHHVFTHVESIRQSAN